MRDPVSQKLIDLAELRESRNRTYGNTPKMKGDVMKALFPNGVKLNNSYDQARYSILSFIVSKLIRYCNNFERGHKDSLDDISVYAQILNQLDEEK